MDGEENETPQSDSEERKPDQEQKDRALYDLYRTYLLSQHNRGLDRILKNVWRTVPNSYELEWLLQSGSLDPRIVNILLNYLSRQQKSSSLTKDEVKSLIVEALNEATKAAAALKPKPGDVLEVAASQLPRPSR